MACVLLFRSVGIGSNPLWVSLSHYYHTTMNRFSLVLVGLFIFSPCFCTFAEDHSSGVSPGEALEKLKEGNQRFVEDKAEHPNADKDRLADTAKNGQYPFATILSCSDSRVPLELLFDQGFGDIFVVRVAGNTSGGDEMGSLEYCVDHLGTPLLVVLGHTKCGAVTAAATHAETTDHLTNMIQRIEPATEEVQKANPDKKPEELITKMVEKNVWNAVETILADSRVIRKLVEEEKVEVIAAMYDIETGKVTFLGKHPKQDEILKKPIVKRSLRENRRVSPRSRSRDNSRTPQGMQAM